MSTQHFFMPLVVVGLVVLTLALSGIVRRYQQQQAARRSVVKRMETGIRLVEGLLQGLKSLPLAFKLRQALRQDALNRYRTIGRIYRDYPRLEVKLKEAQACFHSEPNVTPGCVPEVIDEPQIAALVADLDELSGFVGSSQWLSPPVMDVRKGFVDQLGELRAELLSKFHMAHFRQKYEAGDANNAQDHLRRLMDTLKTRGPNTEKVLELYERAEEEYNASMRRVASNLPETVLKAS